MPVETKCSYWIFAQIPELEFESKGKKKSQAANYGEQVFFWKWAQKHCMLF